MEIKFYWNGSIVGHTNHMFIDGVEVDLGLNRFSNSQEEAKERIVEILKRDYDIDYEKNNIKFEWGGRL
jgi:hypothetical protein